MTREQWMWMQASVSLMAAAAAAVRRDAHDAGTPREHAWRDLVRRLEKTLPHRKPVSG